MIYLVLLLLKFAHPLNAKIIPDAQELQPCPGHNNDMDFANVEFDYHEDGYMIVTGNFTFLKDVVAPYPTYFHSERLERGEWVPAMITKSVPDFCAVIQDPREIWYPVTKNLNQKHCPFKAGFVARVENVRYKFPLMITPNFLGEWRLIMEQRDVTKHAKPSSCWMQYVSVIEI